MRESFSVTFLNFPQVVSCIAQCSSKHIARTFRRRLVCLANLCKILKSDFQFPFQKIAPYIERHLIFFVWHAVTVPLDFTPLQAALKKRLEPFRHSRLNNRPVGKQYDEEHPVQRSFDRVREAYEPYGSGVARNSCVSNAPTWT